MNTILAEARGCLSYRKMLDMSHLQQTALSEILPHLESIGKVDLCDPDLDW